MPVLAASVDKEEEEVARIECGTTAGQIVLELHRPWSPAGYDRAVNLFSRRFYDHSHFFRTVPHFLVQFGISYSQDEALQQLARTPIPDDPPVNVKFGAGTISYAGSGPNSRTSQLFISLREDGGNFGKELWETPIGKVVEGMENVRDFYSGYGDMPPWGKGPVQGDIRSGGAAYMEENFPLTDHFLECHVIEHVDALLVDEEDEDEEDAVHLDHRKVLNNNAKPTKKQKEQHHESLRSHRSEHQRSSQHAGGGGHHHHHHSRKEHQQQHHLHPGEEFITGQLHHQHGVHFNADPNTEEGLTKLSWELVGGVLLLFFGVLLLWLRFVLSPSKKSRKTS